MYKEYVNKRSELHPVDQFMLELCEIPCLSIRIDVCLTLWDFPWQYEGTCQVSITYGTPHDFGAQAYAQSPQMTAHAKWSSEGRCLKFIRAFICIYILYIYGPEKAQASLHRLAYADSPEPSLSAGDISTEISRTGPYIFCSICFYPEVQWVWHILILSPICYR